MLSEVSVFLPLWVIIWDELLQPSHCHEESLPGDKDDTDRDWRKRKLSAGSIPSRTHRAYQVGPHTLGPELIFAEETNRGMCGCWSPGRLLLHYNMGTKPSMGSSGWHSCFLTACFLNTNKNLLSWMEKYNLLLGTFSRFIKLSPGRN